VALRRVRAQEPEPAPALRARRGHVKHFVWVILVLLCVTWFVYYALDDNIHGWMSVYGQ